MAARFGLPVSHLYRYTRCLSRRGRRRKRAIRSHRTKSRKHVQISYSHHLHHNWRWWFRWGAGNWCWRPRKYAAVQHLFRDYPGRVCFYPLEGCSLCRGCGHRIRITSDRLLQLGLVDKVIPEPLGGAHKEPETVASSIGDCIEKQLEELDLLTIEDLLEKRLQRLLSYGEYKD